MKWTGTCCEQWTRRDCVGRHERGTIARAGRAGPEPAYRTPDPVLETAAERSEIPSFYYMNRIGHKSYSR